MFVLACVRSRGRRTGARGECVCVCVLVHKGELADGNKHDLRVRFAEHGYSEYEKYIEPDFMISLITDRKWKDDAYQNRISGSS